MSSRLDGAVVAVAGAAGPAGRAVVHRLAADGAHVVATGRREGPLGDLDTDVAKAGGSASAEVVDLLDTDAVRIWVKRLRRQHGRVDGMVHLVGGFQRSKSFPETDLSAADQLYEQLVGTLARTMVAFHDVLLESPAGRFAIVSSVAASHPTATAAAYAAAKTAGEAWTLAMADSFATVRPDRTDGPAAVILIIRALVTEQMRLDNPGKSFTGFTPPDVLADAVAGMWDRPAAEINGQRLWLAEQPGGGSASSRR